MSNWINWEAVKFANAKAKAESYQAFMQCTGVSKHVTYMDAKQALFAYMLEVLDYQLDQSKQYAQSRNYFLDKCTQELRAYNYSRNSIIRNASGVAKLDKASYITACKALDEAEKAYSSFVNSSKLLEYLENYFDKKFSK